jgi:hypothetical protein
LDYELFFQAQQDFKETELFAGQFNAQVSRFDLLYYRAELWKHNRFNVLNDINETNQDKRFDASYFSSELPKQDKL